VEKKVGREDGEGKAVLHPFAWDILSTRFSLGLKKNSAVWSLQEFVAGKTLKNCSRIKKKRSQYIITGKQKKITMETSGLFAI
jgi:hypothetical protein